ncbi:Nipped-B B [Brachionus plicatilis]|uniref:Nipped-B B n=1 Tax=Brachionus plicatilis TaxID=10195 RepID=A0A3M7T7F3_BRAPC|nr:Nipped-B B [Brachionus plicatilis]
MNPSENTLKSESEAGDPPVTFHLDDGDELVKSKFSSSSLGELEHEELDESTDEAGSDDSRVFHKKLNKISRPILHPKKNLILLSHLDAKNSKPKPAAIHDKENSGQPTTKRRKLSALSDATDYLDQMEQVVGDTDDAKLNFKNCILNTMNEILRTNLQLSRKVDQINEHNLHISKRLKRLEQMIKSRCAANDQEVQEDVDLLSDLSESGSKSSLELKADIKQEKTESRPSLQYQNQNQNQSQCQSQNQLTAQSKRVCDAVSTRHPDPGPYRPHHNHYIHQPYTYNYNTAAHPDAYPYQYRFNSMHHPQMQSSGPAQGYRPAAQSAGFGAGSAQNPKSAAALAAAVAAAMAASAGQPEFSQESVEENEYDDSMEEETSGYGQSEVGNGQFTSIVPQHAPIRHIPSSIVDQLELGEDVERLVSRDVIKRCIRKAKHRGNFAANLAAELFSKEERISCNCTGTRGKRQLSPRRLQMVKEITFRMYNSYAVKQAANVSGGQQSAAALLQDFEEAWRKECITAIDAKNRSIGRDLIKNTSTGFAPNQHQSVSPSSSNLSAANNTNSAPAPLADEVF